MVYLYDRLQERSMFSPGVGKVLSSDYESVSVQIKKTLTNEMGTITVVTPAGLVSGNELTISVTATRILPNSLQQQTVCEWEELVRVVLPSPLPASPQEYVASYLRSHPSLASHVTSTVAGNVITYSMIRSGIQLRVTSTTAGLITHAVTQAASDGIIPNVGDGGAIFYMPTENTMNPAIKSLFGYVGLSAVAPIPSFLGVRRAYDKVQIRNTPEFLINPVKNYCGEVVRRGTIQIPLESDAPATLPNDIGFSARYLVDGAFTQTGGFQIVDATAAAPTGTILINPVRTELISVADDRKSALMRLI